MKVRLPLVPSKKPLIIKIPLSAVRIEETPTVSLSKLVQNRIQAILNGMYNVFHSDAKEQEKRRALVRLYTKESNELVKLATLALSSKYLKEIQRIESKVYRLTKYNVEQEQLADQLVYKEDALKLQATPSYDVERAIDVLFRRETNFPASVRELSKILSMRKPEETRFERIEQLLKLHLQKQGVWQQRGVKIKFENGTLVLESFGFRSTLILCGEIENPKWHVLSVEPEKYRGKTIPQGLIKGECVLKELLAITKYTSVVLELEEIYKVMKEKTENKLFEISIAGTSKEFTATILGVFKADLKIEKNWNGPTIFCALLQENTSKIFKDDVVRNISLEIEGYLKKEFGKHVSFSIGRGLVYKEAPMMNIRELQREQAQERAGQKMSYIPSMVTMEKTCILVGEKIVEAFFYTRGKDNEYICMAWDEQGRDAQLSRGGSLSSSSSPGGKEARSAPKRDPSPSLGGRGIRVYYGVHKTEAISSGHEIPVNRKDRLYIEAPSGGEEAVRAIQKKPKELLAAISAYRKIRAVPNIEAKITVGRGVDLLICGTISVKLERKEGERFYAEILGPKIDLKDVLSKKEVQKLVWVAVIFAGVVANSQVFLPHTLRHVITSGSVRYPKPRPENGVMFLKGRVQFSITYTKGRVLCRSEYLLVAAWVQSAIGTQSIRGLESVFALEEIVCYPRLVSTIPLHGVFGGSLAKTHRTSILYRCDKYIELEWSNGHNAGIAEIFRPVKKIRETENMMVFEKSQMGYVLERISYLLSCERAAVFPGPFTVSNEKSAATYYLAHGESLICKRMEGKQSEEVVKIMEKSPDPEIFLMSINCTIRTK